MLNRYLAPSITLSTLLLAACISNPVQKSDFGNYKAAPIAEADIPPGESAIKGERTKIIVLDADDGHDAMAKAGRVGQTISRSISNVLSTGSVEIVDNSMDPKLAEALRIAETQGSTGYNGPKSADFAIKAVVSNVNYGAAYQNEQSYVDKKGKRQVTQEAGYAHNATVGANIRIYAMPSLKLVQSIKVSGKAGYLDPRQAGSGAIGAQLLSKAATAAPENYKNNLLQQFAAKGYVSSRMVFESKNIYRITLGTEQGIKPGDSVQIFDIRKSDTPGKNDGDDDTDEVLVADGKVTEQLGAKFAWVYVADEKKAANVRRGNMVKTHHKDGFGDIMQKLSN